MNLSEIRIVVSTLLHQNKPEVTIATEQFNALLHISQLKHFKNTLGLPEEYAPGQWLPSRLPEVTRIISETLRPFMVFMGKDGEAPLFITDGYANIPSDYYYPLSMWHTLITEAGVKKEKKIEIVTDAKWETVVSSAVIYPTRTRPYCNFKSDFIQFEPKEIKRAKFSYIRKPVQPIFALKETEDGYVYDAQNSVQLEWNELDQLDIINLFVGQLGIAMGRGDILAISEKVKKEGI